MRSTGCYVHIPFCVSKCCYCNFLSQPIKFQLVGPYVKALCLEIDQWGKRFGNCVLDTIFLGGGTPTVLNTNELTLILNKLKETFQISSSAEITIEANPGTLSKEKLSTLLEAGFNRLSIGAQSLNKKLLTKLGRTHSIPEIVSAVADAKTTGWKNISLDLIFGIPGQTIEDWLDTLDKVIDFNLEHLSAYSLTIEDGTPYAAQFAKGSLVLPDEDAAAEMFQSLLDVLKKARFIHYEISNFAKPGLECKHNLGYWQYKEYLGFGTGGVSYLNGIRFKKESNINKYIEKISDDIIPIEEIEYLSPITRLKEKLMLGLRLADGISLDQLPCQEKDYFQTEIVPKLKLYIEAGLLENNSDKFQLTSKGIFLANEVLQAFM